MIIPQSSFYDTKRGNKYPQPFNMGIPPVGLKNQEKRTRLNVQLATFWCPLWSITEQTHGNMDSIVLYTKKQTTTALFISRSFIFTRKPNFAHFGEQICCLYKMKQSHWLLCVAKSCDWSRKFTPLSNLTRTAFREMKTYGESKLNCEIHKPKSLDDALNTAGAERIRLKNLRLRSRVKAIRFEFWMKGALVTVEIC